MMPVGTARAGRFAKNGLAMMAIAFGAVVLFAVLWVRDWWGVITKLGEPNGLVAVDYHAYMDATRSFLAGGFFYPAYELAGPFTADTFPILYPPQAIALFAPFTVLPALTWWLVPIAIVVWVVARHRPSPIVWPLIAFCLWWPFTTTKVLTGNPSLWLTAFLALGTIWRPWSALVLLKPTLAPFALFGAWDRRWWLTAAVGFLPFCWLLPDYARVLSNFQAPGGLLYSVIEVPMLAIPLIAWLGRGKRQALKVEALSGRARTASEPASPAHTSGGSEGATS